MDSFSVLVVDDMAEMASLLEITIKKLGAESVVVAQSGTQAIEIYKNKAFQIVFLDINLPDIGGFEVLDQLKALNEDVHVVMISADSSIDNIRNSVARGAKGFVVKPYTPEKIKEAVDKYSRKD